MFASTRDCSRRRWSGNFPIWSAIATSATSARRPKTGRSSISSSIIPPTAGPGGGTAEQAWEQLNRTGRIEWVNDLAEIPAQYGVKNVYGDLGQIFAQSTMADPRVCAFMMGTLVKGLGADHVVWGSDAVWTGSPQWQIEACAG